ncbi:hypothetical protein TNCV_5027551 [Trichonephila clavipes]|nr:hypothetical protein TNCV_5027551 [Trichonephila clavipes]
MPRDYGCNFLKHAYQSSKSISVTVRRFCILRMDRHFYKTSPGSTSSIKMDVSMSEVTEEKAYNLFAFDIVLSFLHLVMVWAPNRYKIRTSLVSIVGNRDSQR